MTPSMKANNALSKQPSAAKIQLTALSSPNQQKSHAALQQTACFGQDEQKPKINKPAKRSALGNLDYVVNQIGIENSYGGMKA